MAKAPAFQLYTKDFLASESIALMEAEEIGWYILLLCHAWNSEPVGTLPNDDEKLRRLARADKTSWTSNKDKVLVNFPVEGDRRVNARLIQQFKEAEEYKNMLRDRGTAGATARWGKKTDQDGPSMLKHSLSNAQAVLGDGPASASSTETEADYSEEHKLTSQSTDQKTDSVDRSNGSQPQSQPESAKSAPPIQSTPPSQKDPLADLFQLGVCSLDGKANQENPLEWQKRMFNTWHVCRMTSHETEQRELVETKDFEKLSSAKYQEAAGFPPISRGEIEMCMRWALTTSKYWKSAGVLKGTDGFVKAFANIRRQCRRYYAQMSQKKRSKNALIDMVMNEAPAPYVSKKDQPDPTWEAAIKEMREEGKKMIAEQEQKKAAEVTKEAYAELAKVKAERAAAGNPLRVTEYKDEIDRLRRNAMAQKGYTAEEIARSLGATKVPPPVREVEMANVSDL